jgi:hypothetical protein
VLSNWVPSARCKAIVSDAGTCTCTSSRTRPRIVLTAHCF